LNYNDILERTTVYPIPEFPTTEQEGLLTTLLRKKKLPDVIEWIDESKSKIESVIKNKERLDPKDDEALTDWAASVIQVEREKYTFHGFKNEEQVEEQQEEAKPTLGVNDVLKLIYQGTVPGLST
jgi:mediator of RNA polymerase II transcription subunit 8